MPAPARRLVPSAATLAALGVAALGFVPFANMLFARRFAPWYPMVVAYWIVAGGALALLLALMARLRPALMIAAADRVARAVRRPSPAVFVSVIALAALVASAVVFVACFGRQPTDVDEAALLWHAKILLSGHFSLPVDAHQEFFGMDDMVMSGRWYSQFPVGAPAVLALGVATRAAWLLNPFLVALSVAAVFAFARRAYGDTTARVAAVLVAAAPFVMLMGASYASYVPAMLLAAVAIWQLAAWTDASTPGEQRRAATFAGASLGMLVIVRPLDGVALAGVTAALQLTMVRRDRARLASLGAQVAAGAVPIAFLLFANLRTTGSALRLGYDVVYGGAAQFGFRPDPYGAMHTPARGLATVSKYFLELNAFLLGWPVPVLAIVVAGLARLRRLTRWDRFLLGWLAVHTVLYAVYVFEGWFRGPRYLLTLVPAVVVLAARSVAALARSLPAVRRAVALLVLPSCLAVTWLFIGARANLAGMSIRKQAIPAALRVDPARIARAAGLHHALVFVHQDARNRTLFRLWQLGFPHGEAVRLLASVPACALDAVLDREASRSPAPAHDRAARLADDAAALAAQPSPPAQCAADAASDAAGTASYTPFFAANEIDADGHVTGDVIWVTDLGAHDEVLRARFGDRAWYRFGPRPAGAPLAAALTPYDARAVAETTAHAGR